MKTLNPPKEFIGRLDQNAPAELFQRRRDWIRLASQSRFSETAIAKSLRVSRNTVAKNLYSRAHFKASPEAAPKVSVPKAPATKHAKTETTLPRAAWDSDHIPEDSRRETMPTAPPIRHTSVSPAPRRSRAEMAIQTIREIHAKLTQEARS